MLAINPPLPQFFDLDGTPLTAGRLYFGVANQNPETNPITVYWDLAGTQPAAQPIGTLNGYTYRAGTPAPVYVNSDYSLTVRDKLGRTLYYFPSVAAISNDQRLQDSITALTATVQAGITVIAGDGVTDKSAAIDAANTAGKPVLFTGVSVIGTVKTLTVPIIDTKSQIFSNGSLITIDNGLPVRPQWFGSHPFRAAQSLPQPKGGIVLLSPDTFSSSGFAYNGTYMNLDNITFRGEKMPRYADDCRSLTGGSIMQGYFLAYANNLTLENVGIDAGVTFIGAGGATDALACTYPSDALKAAASLRKGLKLRNVITLAKSPTDAVHAAIIGEGYTDVRTEGDVIGMYGIHGVIIKCQQVNTGVLTAYCNSSDGVIVKSDAQATAISTRVNIAGVESHAGGPLGYSPYATSVGSGYGFFLHAFANNLSKIRVGYINETNHARGVYAQFDGAFTMDNIQIGDVTVDGTGTGEGVYLNAPAAGEAFLRFQMGKVVARNYASGMVTVNVDASAIEVDMLHAVNCTNAALAAGAASSPIIHLLVAENCGAAYQITSTAKPLIGKTLLTGTTTTYFQSAGSGLVPTLSNSWAQAAGGGTFNVILNGYGIQMFGQLTSGTTNTVFASLPTFARPPSEKRLLTQGRGAGGQVAVPVQITTAGALVINDAAGGITNVSNYLDLDGIYYPLNN